MISIEQFKIDQKIDPAELDIAALMQAELFGTYAMAAVEARAAVDLAKAQLDAVEARLSLECRSNPSEFGLEKATESAVSQAVTCHSEYVEARDAMYDAKNKSAAADAMTSTIEMKKRMIEVLTTLHGQQYFAGPSVPRDLVERVANRSHGVSAAVVDAQKKKIRRPKGE